MANNDIIPVNIKIAESQQTVLSAAQNSSGVNLSSGETIDVFGRNTKIAASSNAGFTNEELPNILSGEAGPLSFSNANVGLSLARQNYSSMFSAQVSGLYSAESQDALNLTGQVLGGYYLGNAAGIFVEGIAQKSSEVLNAGAKFTAQSKINNTELMAGVNYKNNDLTSESSIGVNVSTAQRFAQGRISAETSYEREITGSENLKTLNMSAGGEFGVNSHLNLYGGGSYEREDSLSTGVTESSEIDLKGEYRVNEMSLSASYLLKNVDNEKAAVFEGGVNYSLSSAQQINLSYECEKDGKEINNSVGINTNIIF